MNYTYRLKPTGKRERCPQYDSTKLFPTYKDSEGNLWYKNYAGMFFRYVNGQIQTFPVEYVEAIKQTGSVLGSIKCTYAVLYDEEGKKLWSLQNNNYGDTPIVACDKVQIVLSPSKLIECYLSQEALDIIFSQCKPHNKSTVNKILANEGRVFIKPIAFDWQPVKQEVIEDADTQPVTPAKKNSYIGLLIAAAALLLNQ